MQMNPHMTGMMPMAPTGMPMMPMGQQPQPPMMAYGQQPQQPYMAYQQPPQMMMQPPQMQPMPMEVQYAAHVMQQQQLPLPQHHHPNLIQQQQPPHHHRQSSGGSGGAVGGGGSGQNPKGRVFIGNLNTAEIGRPDLERIFGQYGQLTEVAVHNGFAFVQFVEESSARAACQREDRRVYGGQTVDVNIASEPKNRRDRHGVGSGVAVLSSGSAGLPGAAVSLTVKDRLGPRRPLMPSEDSAAPSMMMADSSSSRTSSAVPYGAALRERQVRDYLVCGNCRDAFDSLERLTAHKRDGCRRRFVCQCSKRLGEPRTLDCAKCGRQFPSSWELLRHCQADHEISVYANCVYAAAAANATAPASASEAAAAAESGAGSGGSDTAATQASDAAAASSIRGGGDSSKPTTAAAADVDDAAAGETAVVVASAIEEVAAAAADDEAMAAAAPDEGDASVGVARRRGEVEDEDDATEEDEDSEKDD